MTCTVCHRVEVGQPASHMTPEHLEELEKRLGRSGSNEFYMTVGSARFIIDEVIRCRRGICWICDQREKAWQRAEERRLALAEDAMANEGGRCSA